MFNIWMIESDGIESKFENLINVLFGFDIEQRIRGETFNASPLMTVNKSIATIPINGIIAPASHKMMSMFGGTSTIELKRSLEQAANDPKIKGILMPVNSPGGDNSMIDETASLIHDIQQTKPIYAHTTNDNNSAAYYLSSNATKLFAQNRTNRIGSIGTRLVLNDESNAQENGVKKVVIDSGVNKSPGQGSPITAEQKEYFGDIVNELQSYFDDSIKRGRPKVDINAVNDGSIFLARNALKKGLIDGIHSIQKTRSLLEARTF